MRSLALNSINIDLGNQPIFDNWRLSLSDLGSFDLNVGKKSFSPVCVIVVLFITCDYKLAF